MRNFLNYLIIFYRHPQCCVLIPMNTKCHDRLVPLNVVTLTTWKKAKFYRTRRGNSFALEIIDEWKITKLDFSFPFTINFLYSFPLRHFYERHIVTSARKSKARKAKRSIKVIIEGFRADVFKWLKRKGIALSPTWYIRRHRKEASNSTRNVTMSLNGKISHLTFHFLIQSAIRSLTRNNSSCLNTAACTPSLYAQAPTRISKHSHCAFKSLTNSSNLWPLLNEKREMVLKNWLPYLVSFELNFDFCLHIRFKSIRLQNCFPNGISWLIDL